MSDLQHFAAVLESLLEMKDVLDSEVTSIMSGVASDCGPEAQVRLSHLGWNGSCFNSTLPEGALTWLRAVVNTEPFIAAPRWLKEGSTECARSVGPKMEERS